MFKKVVESERAELESKSIQYLRSLADAIGVDSPTLMGKEDLIDEILVVLMGGNSEKKKETRGRPKKNGLRRVFGDNPRNEEIVIEYDDVVPKGLGVGLFTSNEYKEGDLPVGNDYERYIDFYQGKIDSRENGLPSEIDDLLEIELSLDDAKRFVSEEIEELLSSNELDVLYGYIFKENEKFYILENGFDFSKKVDITEHVRDNNYDLRIGDEVHYYLRNGNVRLLLCNQRDMEEPNNRPNFDSVEIVKPSRRMSSINLIDKVAPIAFGSRNLFVGNLTDVKFLIGKTIKKLAKNKKLYIYAVGCDMKKEDFAFLKSTTDVIVNLSSTKEHSGEEKRLHVFTERIKRLVELGKDVLLYINDCNKLSLLTSLVSFGLDAKDLGSVTTIASCDMKEIDGIENKITNFLQVEKVNGYKSSVCVDASKSKTLFMEEFLTVEEIDEIKRVKKNWENLKKTGLENLINNYE